MDQIVNQLIEARNKAGLSLEDLHKKTLIPVGQLQFLESYQYDKIGPSVYVKGFIRRYAQEVGLDLEDLWQPEHSQTPLVAPFKRKKRQQQPLVNSIGLIFRGLVFVVTLCLVGILIYKAVTSAMDKRQPESPPDPPGQNQEQEPEPVPEPEPEPVPEVKIEQVKANNSEAVYLVRNAQALEITLDFTGKCWTRMSADDKLVGSGTFTKGKQQQFTAAQQARIRFGAPRYVNVTVNGIPIELPDLLKGFNLEISLAPAD